MLALFDVRFDLLYCYYTDAVSRVSEVSLFSGIRIERRFEEYGRQNHIDDAFVDPFTPIELGVAHDWSDIFAGKGDSELHLRICVMHRLANVSIELRDVRSAKRSPVFDHRV